MAASQNRDIICTVITSDFVDRALTVFESVRRNNSSFECVALITSAVIEEDLGFSTVTLDKLVLDDELASLAKSKYSTEPDYLRWTLKPILLLHLLERFPKSRIIYADSDTCFFRDPSELFPQLDAILLTLHRRTIDPEISVQEFLTNFLDGFFNAGFVAATIRGVSALRWWAKACLYACEHNYAKGLYADQRYLDLLPLYFDGVNVCKDPGYNVADWNRQVRSRSAPSRIGMIHFTGNTIRSIEQGHDKSLELYLVDYLKLLNACRSRLGGKVIASQTNLSKLPEISSTTWDFHAAVRMKTLNEFESRVRSNLDSFMGKLCATSIGCLICDYDTLFGSHRSFPPARPDIITLNKLLLICESNIPVVISSHRGKRAAEELLGSLPKEAHKRIWVSLYGRTTTYRLCEFETPSSLCDEMHEMWRFINSCTAANCLSINDKLTAGKQLAIRIHKPELLSKFTEVARRAVERLGFRNVEVIPDRHKGGLYIVGDSMCPHDIANSIPERASAEPLCIGTYGDELGSDFGLLCHGLSLSCATVSLDPNSCWNLVSGSKTPKEAIGKYLDALYCSADGLHFQLSQ